MATTDTDPGFARPAPEGAPALQDRPLPDALARGVDRQPVGETLGDIGRALREWRIWLSVAWSDLRLRYRRTWLNLGWVALSFALFALVKITIFGPLSGRPLEEYAAWLVGGFLVFRFVSNSIAGGSNVFTAGSRFILSEPLPLFLHPLKLMATNVMTFGFSTLAGIAICLAFGLFNPMFLAMWPIAVLVYAFNGVWASVIVGTLCTRHRDLMHFVGTVMQVLYFATPILWVPPETGFRATVALYNPFTHYIAILREPLMRGEIPWLSVWVVAGCTTVLAVAGFLVFWRARRRIIFWL